MNVHWLKSAEEIERLKASVRRRRPAPIVVEQTTIDDYVSHEPYEDSMFREDVEESWVCPQCNAVCVVDNLPWPCPDAHRLVSRFRRV